MKNDHRRFLYHPYKAAKIFEQGEDIPEGWVDTPDKFPENIESMTDDERSYYFGVWGWDVKEYEKPEKPDFNLEDLSKLELDDYAKSLGIELDRRKSKANMIADFLEAC